MRIIDEWTEGDLRVTILKMNSRLSMKIEKGLLEQTYKFRDNQFSNVEELKSALSEKFYIDCKNQFLSMNIMRSQLVPIDSEPDNFPEII